MRNYIFLISLYLFVLICICIDYCQCNVNFDIPDNVLENTEYKLEIRDPKHSYNFPPKNYILAIELTKSLEPFNPIAKVIIVSENAQDIIGQYFGFFIRSFRIIENRFIIGIEFTQKAHLTYFIVRYKITYSTEDQDKFSDSNQNIIYKKQINIYIPYKINLKSSSELSGIKQELSVILKDDLMPNQYGTIICTTTGGIGNPNIRFEGIDGFDKASITNIGKVGRQVKWIVQIADHQKSITCRVGSESKTIRINVFHYATNITIDPDIGSLLPRNKNIQCKTTNGYPAPKTQWQFKNSTYFTKSVSELIKSKSYYITNNGSMLRLNRTVPLGSKWIFECIVNNNIPITLRQFINNNQKQNYPLIKQYNFTISDNLSEVVNSNSGTIAFLILVFVTLLIVLAVVVWFYKTKIQQVIGQQLPSGIINNSSSKTKHTTNTDSSSTRRQYQEVMVNERPSNKSSTTPLTISDHSDKFLVMKNNNNNNNSNNSTNSNQQNSRHNYHEAPNNDDYDDEEPEPYTEIVGTIQQRSDIENRMGPIHPV